MILSANLVYWVILSTLLGLAIREINKKTKQAIYNFKMKVPLLAHDSLCRPHLRIFTEKNGIPRRKHDPHVLHAPTPHPLRLHPSPPLWKRLQQRLVHQFLLRFLFWRYVFKKVFANIVLLAGPGVCWVTSLKLSIIGGNHPRIHV